MNLSPRCVSKYSRLAPRLLAFVVLAGIASAATALDSTRYNPIKTGYQWIYKNQSTGATNTVTVGSQVRLPSGALAYALASEESDYPGFQTTTYETSDQNGSREHQVSFSSTDISGTTTYAPPLTYLPPNSVVGNTYSYSGTINSTTTYQGTPSTTTYSVTTNIQIAGFETVSNDSGTQSWPALKVVFNITLVDTQNAISSTSTQTTWYADGVGVVQYTAPNASGGTETSKLVSTNVVPFSVAVTATITATKASVTTKISFKQAEVGKTGAVYVTAVVPPGSLVPASSALSARSAGAASSAQTAASSLVLVQLTSNGTWQPVVNGQLIPYANGVLGDQLAAQTILNNADATILKGAQFCLGYGTSAEEMAAAGRMQFIATIPDPNAANATPSSCLVGLTLTLAQGWNLVGNSAGAALDVAAAFGNSSNVTSVWKWIADTQQWAFYTPALTGQALTDYAAGKGYAVLTAAYTGEGVWVNAKSAFAASLPPGAPVTAATFQSMGAGWNLIAVGESPSASAFNKALSTSAPAAGQIPINLTTLWAWDPALANWYFYAPSLEQSSGLASYIASKGYLDFGSKTLGPTTGFWVNKP